ncbi:hypothetical protein [Vitiosangium sp. GDMCC 1.1324]|uniref:hypothetical protein n=1 Tax=Vitiosangium sp. (strain GDMCC 1.1324) TaxID=2138576 RepID=UPI000D3906E7|nr:hypothetical protein [Vitiosangium sp. GDMCC 1.1324]PTL82271.1 hypothetical protein DAT35_21010 [Vitiosangium sp. GDMCC 1.1324]
MFFFLIVMCVGLVGLSAMAVPGIFHHGQLGHGGGHSAGHSAGHVAHPGHMTHGHGPASPTPHHGHVVPTSDSGHSLLHFLPEPRLVFSLLALYGAFGNLLVIFLTPHWLAALLALVPALLVERFVLAPLWKLASQFQGQPCSPLPGLLMEEAHAVTPFHNGKGMVQVIHDGRSVQLSARLVDGQALLPVRVGDKLRIEEVDAENERVTVSLF